MKIRITVGDVSVTATLRDTELARAIYEALPFDLPYTTWGDEIYFGIPVHEDISNGQEIVEVGDLGYWPPGHAFCIFYGRTPASTDDRPRAASEIEVWGTIDDSATDLRDASASTIVVEQTD